jgi:hypothetical protein
MGKRFVTTKAIVFQGITVPISTVGQIASGDISSGGQIADGYKEGQSTSNGAEIVLWFNKAGGKHVAVPMAMEQVGNYIADVPVNTALTTLA